MDGTLVKYDAACRAVAEAMTADDAKDIRDKAEAMRSYAKQAKNRGLEIDAAEIRFRAERRLGEIIKEQKETVGLATGGGDTSGGSRVAPPQEPATLSDAGIDKKLSSRSQKLADIPVDTFEGMVSDWRQKTEEGPGAVLLNVAHVSNNSGENEWYTPSHIIAAARMTMGSIDTDPASCAKANEIICAQRFYSTEQDGLGQQWQGNVWMNPPYSQPLIAQFCETFVRNYKNGMFPQGIVLVNNATETGWCQNLIENCSAVCFPMGRVKFIDAGGNPGAPLQGQALFYFGPNKERFQVQFSNYGAVLG